VRGVRSRSVCRLLPPRSPRSPRCGSVRDHLTYFFLLFPLSDAIEHLNILLVRALCVSF
jgi:hypothetical protein